MLFISYLRKLNNFKNIFIYNIFIIFSFLSSLEACQIDNDYYIFFRGYHFLEDQNIDLLTLKQRGIFSRPLSDNVINKDDIEEVTSKICSLNRPWSSEERKIFKSDCNTPYQELVQLYTNSYKKFTSELKDVNSQSQKILSLVDLKNIDSNFFISTSLKASQAYKYAAGLKLYGNDHLRRYPMYQPNPKNTSHFKPKNLILGYVDIFAVPKKEVELLGAFFVVDSFAIGSTKLKHHFSMNLTEEREVIFPFHIPSKYHCHRQPVQLFDLQPRKRLERLNCGLWIKKLEKAQDVDSRNQIELNLVESYAKYQSDFMEENVKKDLAKKGKERVFNGPQLMGLGETLIPADAIVTRDRIFQVESQITQKFFNKSTKNFSFPVDTLDFYYSHAIRRISGLGYPVNITAKFSINSIDYENLEIFISESNIKNLSFRGDPMIASTLCKEFFNISIHDFNAVMAMDKSWFQVNKVFFDKLINFGKKRSAVLTIDVEGLGIDPQHFETKFGNTICLIDAQKDEVKGIYDYIMEGADWVADCARKEAKLERLYKTYTTV